MRTLTLSLRRRFKDFKFKGIYDRPKKVKSCNATKSKINLPPHPNLHEIAHRIFTNPMVYRTRIAVWSLGQSRPMPLNWIARYKNSPHDGPDAPENALLSYAFALRLASAFVFRRWFPSSVSTAWEIGTIMAVVAVLLIHIDRKAVVAMKPNINLWT